jgi:ribonuclease Z
MIRTPISADHALAEGADVLVLCCSAAAAQLTSDHLRNLATHTLACGDTVGKIAAKCDVGTRVLTHHRPGQSEAMLQTLAAEVAGDFGGTLNTGYDGLEIRL